MLGVLASPLDQSVIQEFFELFKIPWESCRPESDYHAVLCAGDLNLEGVRAKVVLMYSSARTGRDSETKVQAESECTAAELTFHGETFPIYGKTLTFRQGSDILTEATSGRPVISITE